MIGPRELKTFLRIQPIRVGTVFDVSTGICDLSHHHHRTTEEKLQIQYLDDAKRLFSVRSSISETATESSSSRATDR